MKIFQTLRYISQSRLITITTDFGTVDGYTGAMKGIIHSLNPQAKIEEITQSIQPQNIKQASFTLANSTIYFPKNTIHLCVVDPGVGTSRQPIVAEFEHGVYVCPNNGCLTNVVQKKAFYNAYVIENPEFMREEISNTFHGRDIFSVTAAKLSMGHLPEEVGQKIEKLILFEQKQAQVHGDMIEGCIDYCDIYGNLMTNIRVDIIPPNFEVVLGGKKYTKLSKSYAEMPEGSIGVIINSQNFLEIAANKGSAKEILKLDIGDRITINLLT